MTSLKAAALLIILLVIFFWPAVFAGQALVPTDLIFQLDPLWQPLAPEGFTFPSNRLLSDQVYQFYPWKLHIVESFADGTLPLWNPYVNGGQPLLANAQTAIFSPFTLLSLLFPLNASFAVTAGFCLFVAGLSTFLLAQEIGIGKYGALVAMVTFTFSGPLIVWPGHPHTQAIAWLPALLFLTERAFTRPSKLYVIAAGVVVGAQFLAGHPETSFHVMLVWICYSLYRAAILAKAPFRWRAIATKAPFRWRAAALQGWRLSRAAIGLGVKTAAAATIGLMISAVQLLPFLEFVRRSVIFSSRASQLDPPLLSTLLLDWHAWPTLITALLPQFFGTPLNDSYWYPFSNYNEQTLYAGILPLALALVSATRILKRRRSDATCPSTLKGTSGQPICFFLALGLLSLCIALHFPLVNLINRLPIFDLAVNGRLRNVYVLAVAILAGFGLDQVMADRLHPADELHPADRLRPGAVSPQPEGGNSHQVRMAGIPMISTLAVIILLTVLIIPVSYAGLALLKDEIIRLGRSQVAATVGHPLYPYPVEYYYRKVEIMAQKMAALFHPRHVLMYLPVWIGLVAFGVYRWLAKSGQRARVWAGFSIVLIFLDLFLVGASYNPTIEPEQIYPTPQAIRFLQRDTEFYRVAGLGLTLMPNSSMVYQLSDVRGYDAVAPQRYMDLFDQMEDSVRVGLFWLLKDANSPLLDLLNVKYVLTQQELGGKWELVYQDDDGMNVYQNRNVMPRAFVVHQAEYADDAEESLARLTGGQFDYRTTVILEEGPVTTVSLPDEPAPTPAEVQITHYEPERVEVQARTSADGILVLTDGYDPGWQARLDGQPVKTYVANHVFRAVALPAGEHQVTFLYDPPAFKIGAGISLVACGGVVITVVARLSARRRPTRRRK